LDNVLAARVALARLGREGAALDAGRCTRSLVVRRGVRINITVPTGTGFPSKVTVPVKGNVVTSAAFPPQPTQNKTNKTTAFARRTDIKHDFLSKGVRNSKNLFISPRDYEAVKRLGQAPSRPLIFQGFRRFRSEPVPFFHSRDYGGVMAWPSSRIAK
jgi:hypothetical protein